MPTVTVSSFKAYICLSVSLCRSFNMGTQFAAVIIALLCLGSLFLRTIIENSTCRTNHWRRSYLSVSVCACMRAWVRACVCVCVSVLSQNRTFSRNDECF